VRHLFLLFLLLTTFSIAPVHAQTTVDLCVDDFEDLNRNGLQDAGEPALAGIEVFLQQDSAVVASLVTTLENDCFTGLQAGTYSVETVASGGIEITTESPQTVNLSAQSQTVAAGGVAFQQVPGNQICFFVFHDENQNGIRESAEGLMPGIDVNLLADDVIVDTLTTTATDKICFVGLEAQTYQVVVPPARNHNLVSRRDAAISFEDIGNEVNIQFAGLPVNPVSDDAKLPAMGSGELDLDQQNRLTLSAVGAGIVIAFMIGLGMLLYGLIRS
jgi:hypothetical protein